MKEQYWNINNSSTENHILKMLYHASAHSPYYFKNLEKLTSLTAGCMCVYYSQECQEWISPSLVITIKATLSPHRGWPIRGNDIHLSYVCRDRAPLNPLSSAPQVF